MDRNSERILIVHAISSTDPVELDTVRDAVRSFIRIDSSVRTEPIVFEIPSGASPGASLASALTEELRACVGAVIFVDDLRPNVAYELGFFHGQGRTVLLLAHRQVDSVWTSISDLAGASLVAVDRVDITTTIHNYLNRLYDELGTISAWALAELPSRRRNLLREVDELRSNAAFRTDGEWGPLLELDSWNPVDFNVGMNLLPGAGFKVVLRAVKHDADYSIYFRVRFSDRMGVRRRAWLGLTSRRSVAGLDAEERTLPAHAPTLEWQMLTGRFQEVINRGHLQAVSAPFFLESIRVRAGIAGQSQAKPIQIGFIEIIGVDH
jgi:hypothetical protein